GSNGFGTTLWSRRIGNEPDAYGGAVVVDVSGNVYVTGSFRGTGTFGGTNLVSNGGLDAYLAKYDVDGNLVWVRQIGGSGDDQGYAVALDSEGNIYVTGYFSGTVG